MADDTTSLSPQQLLRQGFSEQGPGSADQVREVVAAAQMLFDGRLQDLAEDLRRRREGQPYLFAGEFTHADGLMALIQRLQEYERRHGVELASVLEEESP